MASKVEIEGVVFLRYIYGRGHVGQGCRIMPFFSVAFFWNFSVCIRTFHIRMLEKGSINVYNCVGGIKWIFRLLNI